MTMPMGRLRPKARIKSTDVMGVGWSSDDEPRGRKPNRGAASDVPKQRVVQPADCSRRRPLSGRRHSLRNDL